MSEPKFSKGGDRRKLRIIGLIQGLQRRPPLGFAVIAGLEKDPEDAGRIIAAAITRAEPSEAGGKPTAPKAKAPDGIEDHPDHTPKPKAPSKPKTPAGPAGKTAK